MKKILLFALLLSLLCVLNCSCQKKNKVHSPDLTKEQSDAIRHLKTPILRYEQALFGLDVDNLPAGIQKLYGKFPENLISNNCWNNVNMMRGLKGYLSDPTIKELYKETQRQYGSMDDVERQLNEAFKLYLTHFPDAQVPKIYTLVSGMDFSMPSVFGYDDNIFICLDMYLGKNYKYYASAGMPRFISERCEKKYMATDCFSKGVCYKQLPDKTLLTLLDNMVDAGKILFFTQTMFPNVSEQDILGYNDEKYAWAKEHQAAVWQYLVEKELLYSKDDDVIQRMIDETPFTRDFGNASAGRMGAYIGLKIVQSYMKNRPNTTLGELMKMTSSQRILDNAYYKPSLN